MSSGLYLQEGADLLCQLQEAVLALVQGAGDGHTKPLPQCLRAALVEEVGGRAALRVDAVLQRLCQEDGAGADGAICGQKGRDNSTTAAASDGGRDPQEGNGRQSGLGRQGTGRESQALASKLVLFF